MKYKKEYKKYTKEQFIRYVSKNYKIKKASALRTWNNYKAAKKKKIIKIVKVDKPSPKHRSHRSEIDEVSFRTNKRQNGYMKTIKDELDSVSSHYKLESYKPSRFKLLLIDDMRRYNLEITDSILRKHGFCIEEIEWMKEKKMI